ncbi:MAG TPA: XRE family transcriptional regulator [Hyphomicrobiales bacterium]|nr:XRE family transcriptional regulator [Hyphomicrobiales bacterium]
MSKPFEELRKQLPASAQRRAKAKTRTLAREMRLAELRQARQLSQQQIAESLRIKQASISKLERRTDMYISTLRNFIRAVGGELEIVAQFPEGNITITQFEELG